MTEEEKRHKRQSILDLIAAAALSSPKQGWDVIAEKTGFTRRAIEISGSGAGNFVDAIAAVGLTRFDAVEEFRNAKRNAMAPAGKGRRKDANANTAPAAMPGDVVHPQPERPAVPDPARRDPGRTADDPPVVASGKGPGRDPGGRREVRRKAEREARADTQTRLF